MILFDTQLPQDWSWEPISRRYRITKKPKGRAYSSYTAIPFVPMESVPLNGAEAVRFELRRPSDIASGTYFEKGDVLLSKITPSFENGKQGLAHNIPVSFGVASTEIIPLQAITSQASHRFLFFYLLHPEVRATLASKMEGSTGRQRVPEHAVLDFPMPVPPPLIEAKISAILGTIQRAIKVEEKIIATARELKQSAMRQLFTHGLRAEDQKQTDIGPLPKTWEVVPLSALARIGNGSTPLRTNLAYWNAGTIPWLTSAKVYDVTIAKAEQFITPLAVAQCHLPTVKPGSVLVAITGQGKTLGHAAVTAIATCVSQHIAFLSFTSDSMNPHFVRLFLDSRYSELRGVASGGGSTKGALTCGFLKTYLVPQPEREEQNSIAKALMTIEAKISTHERKRDTLQELFKTMLHQLMTAQIRVDKLDIDTSDVALG